nr:MAG TPA: SprT-like family protein [Caudoviricetes sp.]
MTLLNLRNLNKMKIPEKFTINSQEITVEVLDTLPDQKFGEYNCITDRIKLAKCVKDDDGTIIPLKEEQILNTFIHELLHAFQWHSQGDTSETESNTYAGYFVEFIKSSGLTIN